MTQPQPTTRTAQDEVGPLLSVVVRSPRAAWAEPAARERWVELGYTGEPDPLRASVEHDRFVELLAAAGADVLELQADRPLTMDSIYTRDAAVVSDRGAVLCRMGKAARADEPEVLGAALASWDVPVLGRIEAPGKLEGGDVVWLDSSTLAVGLGYRSNREGVEQLKALLGDACRRVVTVPLPHYRGPSDVFHLMSILSPIDRDLALIYSPLMPVPFRDLLLDRGMRLVEVPDSEFETMGSNALALAPRRCVLVAGNRETRWRLEREGVEVLEYEGWEVSLKGGGGPTCLARTLRRG